MNPNNFKPIQVGEKFTSHDQLLSRLQEHKQATMSDFFVRDCRTLARAVSTAPRSLKANPELKYYYTKLSCIYGGSFKSKNTGQRRRFTGSFRQGCPANIYVGLSTDCQYLVVKSIVDTHNHEMNPSILRLKSGGKVRKQAEKLSNSTLMCHSNKIVHEGYVYTTIPPARRGKMYLKCMCSKCPGRAKKLYRDDGTGDILPTKEHSHDPDMYALQRLQFRENVYKRAAKEAVPLRKIFEDECAKFPGLSDELEYEQYYDEMAEKRKNAKPTVPKTLQQLGYLIVSEEWCYRFACNLEDPPREMFIGAVKGKGGETAAVFASMYLCSMMNKPIPQLHIDVSYKNLPTQPFNLKNLLTIHFVEDGYSFAGVYAMMSSMNLAAFLAVLKFVRDELLPECAPEIIFSDFRAELQLACKEVFSNASFQGSSFYYSKDVWEKSQTLNLLDLPQHHTLKQLVMACMSLPFLPASLMECGLNAITSTLSRLEVTSPLPLQLVQHVRYSWLEAIGVKELSAHDQPERSNQNISNFHRELDYFADKEELTPWRFVEILQRVEQNHRTDHKNLQEGCEVRELRQAHLLADDSNVHFAAAQLESGKIGIMDFLEAVSSTLLHITEPDPISAEEAGDEDEMFE